MNFGDKITCIKDLIREDGFICCKKGTVWRNATFLSKSVKLVRENEQGEPEWLNISENILKEYFE